MPGGQGLRHRTRDLFQRGFRQKGFINLSTYLRVYKLGDYVDIKMNPAVQKVGCVLGGSSARSGAILTSCGVCGLATRSGEACDRARWPASAASRRLRACARPPDPAVTAALRRRALVNP